MRQNTQLTSTKKNRGLWVSTAGAAALALALPMLAGGASAALDDGGFLIKASDSENNVGYAGQQAKDNGSNPGGENPGQPEVWYIQPVVGGTWFRFGLDTSRVPAVDEVQLWIQNGDTGEAPIGITSIRKPQLEFGEPSVGLTPSDAYIVEFRFMVDGEVADSFTDLWRVDQDGTLSSERFAISRL